MEIEYYLTEEKCKTSTSGNYIWHNSEYSYKVYLGDKRVLHI